MKSIIKKTILTALPALFLFTAAIAQPPPPDDYGENEDMQPAPIGSGIAMLLVLGAGYGAKKVYDGRKRLNN